MVTADPHLVGLSFSLVFQLGRQEEGPTFYCGHFSTEHFSESVLYFFPRECFVVVHSLYSTAKESSTLEQS